MPRTGRGVRPEFPTRRLIAFVTRVETIGPAPYGRTSFEFDALDADTPEDEIERAIISPDIRKPFAALRVVTTRKRFDDLFDFVPAEGMWVDLEIRSGLKRAPIVFHTQLDAEGYVEHSRGMLESARLLFDPGETPSPPVPLSASVAGILSRAALLVALCAFPQAAVGPLYRVRAVLRRLRQVSSIRVRDVGQASFVSLLDADDKPLAHFDAGWPISYNRRTAPKKVPAIPGDAPVILSHWDWDHIHGYYRMSALQDCRWLVPIQPMGPGARKIAAQLHAKGKLIGYAGPPMVFAGGVLVPCGGPSRLNDTGLALVQALSSGELALLVGDAGYDALGSGWSAVPFDLLVVTHHGALFTGAPPRTNGEDCSAIVSVGAGNVYQHPRQPALTAHRNAGWDLRFTMKRPLRPRGDRFLGP